MDQLIYAVESSKHKRTNNDGKDDKISHEKNHKPERMTNIDSKRAKRSKMNNTEIQDNPVPHNTNTDHKLTTLSSKPIPSTNRSTRKKDTATTDSDGEDDDDEEDEGEDDAGGDEDDDDDDDDDNDEEDTSSTHPDSRLSTSSTSSSKLQSSTDPSNAVNRKSSISTTTVSTGGGEKIDRRRELNRMNAKKSRQRKKVFVDQLHDRLQEVEHNLNVMMTYVANVLHMNPQDILNGTAPGLMQTHHQHPLSSYPTHPSKQPQQQHNNSHTMHMSAFYPAQQQQHNNNNGNYDRMDTSSSSSYHPSHQPPPSSFGTTPQTYGAAISSSSSSDAKELLSFAQQSNPTNSSSSSSSSSSTTLTTSRSSSSTFSSSSSISTTSSSSAASTAPNFTLSKVPTGIPPPEPRLMQSASRSRDSFVMCDPSLPDIPIVWASPGFLHLTGYPYHEILGRNCRFLQCPETDKEVVKQLSLAIKEGRETSCVLLNQRKDGTRFWNCLTMSPLYDNNHKVVAIIGIQVDVTAENNPSSHTNTAGNSLTNPNKNNGNNASTTNTLPTVPPTNNIELAQEHAQSLLATISAEAIKVAESMGGQK